MSSQEDWLTKLNKRVWEAHRSVQEKLENIQTLKGSDHEDLQQQIQDKTEELDRLRDERNEAEEMSKAWHRVTQNSMKELRERTLLLKRLENQLADVKRADEKLSTDIHSASVLLENILTEMGIFGSKPLSVSSECVGRGFARETVAEYRRLESELQNVHREKSEKTDIMIHVANEKVIPALILANSASLPLKLKLELKEVQSIIEQKDRLRSKLQAKGVDPERAIGMSDREVRVHCSQRSSAAIQERLEEQRNLAEEAKQRKAEADQAAAVAEAEQRTQGLSPRQHQDEHEGESDNDGRLLTDGEPSYPEGYSSSAPTDEPGRGRRRVVEPRERGRPTTRNVMDRSWRSTGSPRTDDDISDFDSRAGTQPGASSASGPRRQQPQTGTSQREFHDHSDRYSNYPSYPSRDYPTRRDESPTGYSCSRSSVGDRPGYSMDEDSRAGSPNGADRTSPLSLGRVDLTEEEPSNIFGNSAIEGAEFMDEDNDRLF